MKHVRKFNENNSQNVQVRVRHLIEYLQKFDPETPVGLDKDGWEIDQLEPTDEIDLIEKRGLFDYFRSRLIINN